MKKSTLLESITLNSVIEDLRQVTSGMFRMYQGTSKDSLYRQRWIEIKPPHWFNFSTCMACADVDKHKEINSQGACTDWVGRPMIQVCVDASSNIDFYYEDEFHWGSNQVIINKKTGSLVEYVGGNVIIKIVKIKTVEQLSDSELTQAEFCKKNVCL